LRAKASLRWWFLNPTIYVLRTGHNIDNIRADIYDSFFGNDAEMGSFTMHPERARGENFNRNLQNSFFFSSFFGGLGRILRSWEHWVDDCSVSLKVDHSLNLRLQLRQKIRKLFICCQKIIICSPVPSFR
jgi:hypothetical protein